MSVISQLRVSIKPKPWAKKVLIGLVLINKFLPDKILKWVIRQCFDIQLTKPSQPA